MNTIAFGITLTGIGDESIGKVQLQVASAGLAVLLGGITLLTPPAQQFINELLDRQASSMPIIRRSTRLLAAVTWIGLIALLTEYIGFLVLQEFPYFSVGMWVVLAAGISLLTSHGRQIFSKLLSSEVAPQSWRALAIGLLVITLWFGLVSGLVDGIGSLILQRFEYQDLRKVWTPIAWIAPISNVLIFGVAGLILCGIALLSRHLKVTMPVMTVAVFVFCFLTLFEWLWKGLSEWIHDYAILILALALALMFTTWFTRRHAATLRIFRTSLPVIAALTIMAFIGIQGGYWLKERMEIANLPQAPSDSPNVLVIVADTLRADHLSAYGYQRPTSPNIDQMAEQGTLFETALSASPWTLPSHASFLTGLYPHEHNLIWSGNQPRLDEDIPTLSEYLHDRGYRTAAFSANTGWFTRVQGFGRGFIHFEDFFHSPQAMIFSTTYGSKIMISAWLRLSIDEDPTRKWATDINSSTLRWLGQNRDVPFFVFLNYFDVHAPYAPPQPYGSMFKDAPRFHEVPDNPGTGLTKNQLLNDIDHYDGAIAYMDEHIGRLLADVQEMGFGDDLIVIFTSDHGEAFGEHGQRGHRHSVYREEIHVPLIFWSPGNIPGGLRISQPVSNVSLAVTIADMLEGGESAPFPGESLAQLWESPSSYPDWPFPLSEMEHHPWMANDGPSHFGSMRSLVSPDWHYIEHDTLGYELYRWRQDQTESQNLSKSAEGKAIIDRFEDSLETVFARNP